MSREDIYELREETSIFKNFGEKLFLDKELCDVKILCENRIFECHKIVLCLQSEVFKRMLAENNMTESKSGEISITETTFEALLYFIYHSNFDESKINADLLTAVDFYNISGLVELCVSYLTANLSDKNVTADMISAYMINQKELFNLASRYVNNRKLEGQTLEKEALESLKKKDPKLALEIMTEALFNVHIKSSKKKFTFKFNML